MRILGILLALLPAALLAAQPAKLAAGGQALMPIVIAENASQGTKDVANELAGYLGRVTGAQFTVQTGDGSRGIVLGTPAQFPNPALNKPLEIRNTYDGKEAYVIRTEQQRVLLIGGAEQGVPHAAFRLLEEIGCRWFFPAKEWEVVPSVPNLTVNLDIADRPALLARRIWYGYGPFPDKEQRPRAEYNAWARHNRMGASHTVNCGHAWQTMIADNKALIAEHPEYLALVKGERRGPQLCVSNPAVRQMMIDWTLAQFRKRPDADMVSVETSDGSNHCECENCVKMGNISERAFGIGNEIARAVTKEFPGKMVGMYAYNDHCEPPSFKLEPNVYVQSTAGFIRGKYTFDELMEIWPKTADRMGFYLYFSVWLWDFDMLPGGNGGNLKYIREQIPRMVQKGATSIDCESGCNWGPHGRGYYIANKLMWNPKADVDALLQDFYTKAFGPGAAAMQRYYERLDPGNKPLMSEHLLALAFRDVEEASRLAKDRPDVLARLDHVKQYLHYVRLRWEYLRAPKEAKEAAAMALLTHAYRTRYSYMNHWNAIRQEGVKGLAKDVNRPEWTDPKAPKPWEVGDAYTREETETLFREDLARFQPQPVQEVKFSDNLVPSGLTSAKPADSVQKYQGNARYAFYSVKGEPLEYTIATGQIAWYRDRPEARYTITDRAGKEVAAGRLPQDGEEHALKIAVPAPGLYWFTFNDSGAAWRITAAAGTPVNIALNPDYKPSHLGTMQRMFFFVPKGTKQIQYFWDGSPHDICGPDGKEVLKVTERGKYIICDVPAGMDGQAWSFTRLGLGRLLFFTCPNYLAASPEALLVPREEWAL
ncbi:MAG: DUF4838 domain-containing protein [Armatimonadota bacterium]